jgi:hypothetical protein
MQDARGMLTKMDGPIHIQFTEVRMGVSHGQNTHCQLKNPALRILGIWKKHK